MRTLTLLGAALITLPVMAAESDFKAMFVKHWQVAKEFTLAVAEAMPAEGYDFKPNPECMVRRVAASELVRMSQGWSAQMYTAFVGVDHSWPGWNALRSLLH